MVDNTAFSAQVASTARVRFELSKEFQLRVPITYSHSKQLAHFLQKHKEEFYCLHSDINDMSCSKVTHTLKAGEVYTIRLFSVREPITSDDCLAFMKSQGALFVGAQGISLVWQMAKTKLPMDKRLISFDEAEKLWKDQFGNPSLPFMYQHTADLWQFSLQSFYDRLYYRHVLICFSNPRTSVFGKNLDTVAH